MSETNKKKYRVIVKVSPAKVPETGKDHCCKYTVTNLLTFTAFLDRKWPEWCWFNVYEYTHSGNGEQMGCFTKNRRPTQKYMD